MNLPPTGNDTAENVPERRLVIRSRMSKDLTLSETGLKSLQHVLTDWFPRTVYFDLTDDTERVDVEIRKSFTGKCAFNVSFIRSDGSQIKKAEYAEERMLGKVCKPFNRKRTRYDGHHDGFDHRLVVYASDDSSLEITQRIPRK